MNIIEAIKSGKRFRRAGQTAWHDPPCVNYPLLNGVSRENLLADDWEVESEAVAITRDQFNEAWDRARTKQCLGVKIMNNFCERDALAKELGL